MKIKLPIRVLIYLSVLVFGAGCTVSKPVNNKILPMPATFTGGEDSLNIADKSWRSFYADTALTLLIDSALKYNQDMVKTLQHIRMTKAELQFSRGVFFPSVSGAAAVGQRRFGAYTMDGVGNYDTQFSPNITADQIIPEHLPDYFVGLQASWEADIWGKLRHRKRAALMRYLASVEGRHLVMTSLVYEIGVLYYDLLAFDNELDIINETITLQENALAVIMIQKQAGIANELAVKQFEAQLFRSRSLGYETRQKINEAEARINFLCGRFNGPIPRNKTQFVEGFKADVKAGVPAQLLRNRPDVRQAEQELRASGADVNAAHAAFYPSLSVSASAGFQAFNPAFLFSPQSLAYSVFGNLMAPLINRAALKAAFSNASARQQEALATYQQSILRAFMEVYTELSLISNLENIRQLKTEESRVLTESIETSSELFRSGRASYLEVLMTQQNALRAKLELVDTRKRQYHAMLNLYRGLGGGWRQ